MGRRREWIQENTWVCPFCSSEQLGRHNKCQGCGAVKGEKVQDRVPEADETRAVSDPELLKTARDAADWHCPYCNSKVRNAKGGCQNCSAPRKNEAEDFKPPDWDPPPQKPPKPKPRPRVDKAYARDPKLDEYYENERKRADRRESQAQMLKVGAIIGGVAALVGLLVWGFTAREVHANVETIAWEYQTDLRQKTLMTGEDWEPIRGDAFNRSCHTKLRRYEDCHCRNVPSGTHRESYDCRPRDCRCHKSCSDRGNGFSRCSESCSTCYDTCYRTIQDYRRECDSCPVYGSYCTYNYYGWPVVASKKTSGSKHDEHWPDLRAVGPDQKVDQYERYSVAFRRKEESWSHKPRTLDQFQKFDVGQRWDLFISPLGGIDESRMKRE